MSFTTKILISGLRRSCPNPITETTIRMAPRTRSAWPCLTTSTTTTSSGTTSLATTRSPRFASSPEPPLFLKNRSSQMSGLKVLSGASPCCREGAGGPRKSRGCGEPNLSLLAKKYYCVLRIKCCFTYDFTIRSLFNTNGKRLCDYTCSLRSLEITSSSEHVSSFWALPL